ncbi:MAG: CcmD family protein [Chitinophagaceae bacterium]|jgi:MFS superfamily sulfate permease-like transporter|nr:CcmD family protein [Chitinophagaceae bacterium]
MKKFATSFVFCLLMLFTLAQDTAETEMADLMRSNGKIYVVIAVMLTILLGLIFYLVRLDKKISRLEKDKH